MFTERQLQYIAYQAQLIAQAMEADLTQLNDDELTIVMTAVGILCDLDEFGYLPPDWEPEHEQRVWLGAVLKTAQGVYREEIAEGSSDSLAIMDDLELCTSVLRSMLTVAR